MKHNRAFTLIELAVVVAIFLAMITVLAPFVRIARSRTSRVNCANNLRQISLALHEYALGHNDAFPGSLGELYPKYAESEGLFDCPATGRRGTAANPEYVYRAGLTETSDAKEIIAQDAEGNHKKSGRNVLRIDGSIDWIKGKQ